MTCPACGLINPPGAERCDCGYAFTAAGASASSRPTANTAPATSLQPGHVLLAIAVFGVLVAFTSWIAPSGEPRPKPKPEPEPAPIGSIMPVAASTVCAPSKEALDRIMDARRVDQEEVARALVREFYVAGWPRIVYLKRGVDQVKVIDHDVPYSLVRPVAGKGVPSLAQGCWVPIDAVLVGGH